jgi:ribokinase
MSKPACIVVVGSCNVDLTTFTSRLPNPGETMFGHRFDLGFGGKGANQAVAAKCCGADVSMVARVGSDLFGEATVKNFASLGIDTTHVRVLPDVSSGVAPIFVDASGENRIIVVKGANDRLMPRDIDEAAPLIEAAACVILQFEVPLETVAYTVRLAHARGVRVIVNPAPAVPMDLDLLSGVDYFIPNETEAELLTGMPVRSDREAEQCAKALIERGIDRVILTLGRRGAMIASEDEGIALVPAFKVEAKDTTGAGDAFIGSFATFLVEGCEEREAVRRANLYAGLSTTAVGTQKSFWSRADFEREWTKRA